MPVAETATEAALAAEARHSRVPHSQRRALCGQASHREGHEFHSCQLRRPQQKRLQPLRPTQPRPPLETSRFTRPSFQPERPQVRLVTMPNREGHDSHSCLCRTGKATSSMPMPPPGRARVPLVPIKTLPETAALAAEGRHSHAPHSKRRALRGQASNRKGHKSDS